MKETTCNNISELRRDEYKMLKSQIDSDSKMQIQVFTFSIVASTALLGIFFNFGNAAHTPIAHYVFIIPPLIIIPCAYLIKNLRAEIYRAGTYIQVFIENDTSFLYEGALGKIRERFNSKESFDPIFSAYWIFIILCFLAFLATALEAGIPVKIWQSLPWLLYALFLARANRKYKEIPNVKRLYLLEQWRAIKADASLSDCFSNRNSM